MAEIIDRLRAEHANIARLTAAVEKQLAVFNAGGRPDYDLMAAALEYFATYAARHHHPTEDLVYEKLQARDPDAAKAAGDLLAEHARLEVLTRRFAEALHKVVQESAVPRAWFDGEARAFITAQQAHSKAEEERFFPAAEAALSAEDWAELATRGARGDDPLFGAKADKRFAALRREIDALAATGK
jgi:hemerythrin-like domain-containing protein